MILYLRHCTLLVVTWLTLLGSVACTERVPTTPSSPITPTTPTPPTTPGCTYDVSPTNRTHGPGAETGTVSVTAPSGCAWTASSGVSWVTFPSGNTGTGNGMVTYVVEVNTGPSRTGTLTVAGRGFTVTQAEMPPAGSMTVTGGSYGSAATVFSFNPAVPAGTILALDISGPAGWNGGNPFRCTRYQPSGTSLQNAICWMLNAPAVTGAYTARATVGVESYSASFSINSGDQLPVPQVRLLNVSRDQVAMEWTASSAAGSFIARIQPVPFTTSVRGTVLSPTERSTTFTALSLLPGSEYDAVVFVLSSDIRFPAASAAPFNMGSAQVRFRAP